MKKLSIAFGVLAIILSDIMCAVVAYNYCKLQWLGEHGGTSAPASIAFLYCLPYVMGMAACAALSVAFWKKQKNNDKI